MDLIGTLIDGYRVEAWLGRGAMGEAYLAHDSARGEQVVIKLLVAEYQHDPQFLARFQREMRLLRELAHPHIVPIYAWGLREENRPYLVMKYIAGQTLYEVLLHRRLSPHAVNGYLQPIVETLDFIHWRGVLHRDIKPANIFIQQDGHLFMGDFGLSKQVGVDLTITETATTLGTPEYMSPEVVRGLPSDHRSDIYSLGVMLYEMLLGMLPFQGGNSPMRWILAHASTPPLPPRTYRPDFPLPLQALLLKCLAKTPDDRPQSAGELGKAYINALQHLSPGQAERDYWLR